MATGGGASAPPRLRDGRGRFCRTPRFLDQGDEAELLAEFLRVGVVSFPDPRWEGVFTMERGESMKGYRVRLFHTEYEYGAWHRCPGGFDSYGRTSSYGRQLAISPRTHYGMPGDKWDGERRAWTVEGMAQLLLHLVFTKDLAHLECGEGIYSGEGGEVY